VSNPEGSLLRQLQDTLQHVIGFAPVMFFGRGIFQAGSGVYAEIQVCLKMQT
jgi:hypothetical protein